MSRQHPWPHAMGKKILISITVSEILGHCQNLLDDPRSHGGKSSILLNCFKSEKELLNINM